MRGIEKSPKQNYGVEQLPCRRELPEHVLDAGVLDFFLEGIKRTSVEMYEKPSHRITGFLIKKSLGNVESSLLNDCVK